jgi:hypothetical protein
MASEASSIGDRTIPGLHGDGNAEVLPLAFEPRGRRDATSYDEAK